MNTSLGFIITILLSLSFLALTIIYKKQNNNLFFRLGLIICATNLIGRLTFYPLLEHPEAKYWWYLFWVYLELPFMTYIAYHSHKHRFVDKALLNLAMLSIASASLNTFRFFERHYSDYTIIKSIYSYSPSLISFAMLAIFISVAFHPRESGVKPLAGC